ncbi:MAG: hypothetical protein GX312_05210 [Candidatus Phytoplasma sp.]|nr:hypothetical protein [Phytoplasma sp.]
MTVKQYLEENKVKNYVLTNRMRVPMTEEQIKYSDIDDLEVIATEVKNGVLHIRTDYIELGC